MHGGNGETSSGQRGEGKKEEYCLGDFFELKMILQSFWLSKTGKNIYNNPPLHEPKNFFPS